MSQDFQIFITQDGSPTLVWTDLAGYQEKMHHSHGALSESFYIYGEALREVITRGWPVRVLSLGLGLGYNELIALGEDSGAKVWSFEISDVLREGFRAWLLGQSGDPRLTSVYDRVCALVAERFKVEPAALHATASLAFREGRLELRGSFPEDTMGVSECSCVFYDAFSKKMSPTLWAEEMIKTHLNSLTARRAVVTTYAATGALNRALKGLGFQLIEKKGFSGKRESTLAIREV